MEFALIFPVFLLLVYGGLSYGLAMSTKGQITEAAAEGARAAVGAQPINGNYCTGYATAAMNQAQNSLSAMGGASQWASIPTPTVSSTNCSSFTTGVTITVSISYPYSAHPTIPNAPGLGLVLPPMINSTYVVEVS